MSRRREALVVVLLLLVHAALAITSLSVKSATFDEPAHIAGGLLFWERGDFRQFAASGMLPQRLMAMPLLGLDIAIPPADDPAWERGGLWTMTARITHNPDNPYDAMLIRARLTTVLMSLCFAVGVFALARRLGGQSAGLVALFLYAFSPTVLAHARLATSDLLAAGCLFLVVGATWHLCHRITLGRIALVGVAIGAVLTAKMSGLLALPMLAILVGIRLLRAVDLPVALPRIRRRLRGPASRALGLSLAFAAAGVIAWLAIYALYDFRFSARPGISGGFAPTWDEMLGEPAERPMTYQIVGMARDARLLPEAYLWGLLYTLDTAGTRNAFLDGKSSMTGWRSFFPKTVLYKTPLPLMGLVLLALLAWPLGSNRWRWRVMPWVVLLGVYWSSVLLSQLNIGHRHILVTYPVLFLIAAGAGRWFDGAKTPARPGTPPTRTLKVASIILLALFASESFRVAPHYLAYFNQLVGGPSHGWRHLVDSSLDWGQDVPALEAHIAAVHEERPGYPVHVAYFGTEPLHRYRLPVSWAYTFMRTRPPMQLPPRLRPGRYAVSVTLLQSLYLGQRLLGPWDDDDEANYRQLRDVMEPVYRATDTATYREALATRPIEQWEPIFAEWERHRMAKLAHYLRRTEPITQLGWSINVYELSSTELAEALGTSAPSDSDADSVPSSTGADGNAAGAGGS